MRINLLLLLIPTMVAAASADDYELKFSPTSGYSTWSGLKLGLDAALLVPLKWPRWQAKFGGSYAGWTRSSSREYEASTGAVYNLSTEWQKSPYVGGGMNLHYSLAGDSEWILFVEGYGEAGWRVPLNDSHTFLWDPHVRLSLPSLGRGEANLLSFSYVF